jgi:hypothetical protein
MKGQGAESEAVLRARTVALAQTPQPGGSPPFQEPARQVLFSTLLISSSKAVPDGSVYSGILAGGESGAAQTGAW